MRSSPLVKVLRGVWFGVTMLLLLSNVPVFGSTITVSNTNDSGSGSLRAAIASAASGDTINFSVTGTITVSTALEIDSVQPKTLTISGPGATSLAISGGDSVPVFIVQPLGGQGGAITATISGLTIEKGSSVLGGGIANFGTLTLNNVRVTENGASPGTQLGGGIFNAGTLTLNNSLVGFNGANPANNEVGVGGGIYNIGTLTLNGSTVVTNFAFGHLSSGGGGIYNASPGSVTLFNSTIENNETDVGSDAGILLFGIGDGGGIFNEANGTVILRNSTVADNFGGGDEADCCAFAGAGIFNAGNVLLFNSTVAGNHTPPDGSAGGNGGGIANFGSLGVSNSTIANNSVGAPSNPFCSEFCIQSGAGGGILNSETASLTIKNSILANNHGRNCFQDSPATGARTSLGHNLSDDVYCSGLLTDGSDMNSTSAGLDPNGLQKNGGPTETIALLATSVAVNAVPWNLNAALSFCTDLNGYPVRTDQRGVTRPQGPNCDIGAFEYFQSRFQIVAVQTYLLIDTVLTLPVGFGTQQGLVAPLQGAVLSINSGNTGPAINQLGAFINQANGLVLGGVLTQQQASPLTTAAQALIQSLSGL